MPFWYFMQFSNYQLRNNVTLKLHLVIIYCIYHRHLLSRYLIMTLSKLIHYCHPLLPSLHSFSKSISFIADNGCLISPDWTTGRSIRASKHARKYRVDFEVDPILKVRSLFCGFVVTHRFLCFLAEIPVAAAREPDAVFVDAARRQILRSVLARFTLTSLSRGIPRYPRHTRGRWWIICHSLRGPQEALVTGNRLSTVGPECHPRLTWYSLPAACIALILVAIIISNIVNISPAATARWLLPEFVCKSHGARFNTRGCVGRVAVFRSSPLCRDGCLLYITGGVSSRIRKFRAWDVSQQYHRSRECAVMIRTAL